MSDATSGDSGTEGTEGAVTEATEATTTESKTDGGYDRILERMDGLSQSTASLMEQMQQFEQRFAEPEPEYDDDPYAGLNPDDPDYEDQQAWIAMQQAIRDEARQVAQEMVAPIHAERQAEQYNNLALGIEQEFGDLVLGPDGKPTEAAAQALDDAAQLATEIGIDPQTDPRFWGLYLRSLKAQQADKIRAQETPAGGQAAMLEAGGASAGSQPAVDEQQRLMERLAQSQRDPFA